MPTGLLSSHTDFRRLWTAQTISQIGTQISSLAVPLCAVLILHASAFEVSVLSALGYAPYVLIGLPAGVWVDRLRRRPVMIATDLIRAGALLAVPIAAALGALTFPVLALAESVIGMATVFFDFAYQAGLPSLVPPDRLVEANARLTASRSVAYTAGPTGAGWIVALLSAPGAIVADVVSYLASALLVLAIRVPEPAPPAAGRRQMRRDIGEGLRLVLGDRLLRTTTLYSTASSLAVAMAGSVEIVFLVRGVHLSPGAIGVLLGVGSLGAVLGALVAGPVRQRLGDLRTLVVCADVAAAGMLLVPLTSGGTGLIWFVAGFGAAMCAIVGYNIVSIALLQRRCPDRLLGRVSASTRFVAWSTPPIGALLGGLIAQTADPRTAMWVAGAIFLASAAAFTWALRHGAPTTPIALAGRESDPGSGTRRLACVRSSASGARARPRHSDAHRAAS